LGLIDRLLSRKAHPDAERAKAPIRQALEESERPQGGYKMAVLGAELRRKVFALVEEVEANLGGPAVGIVGAEGVLMAHSKLTEKIRQGAGPFGPDLLQGALSQCFMTKDERQKFNEGWPSIIARYRGKSNSENVLRTKSMLLAEYVAYNLDAAEMALTGFEAGRLDQLDEQNCKVQVEEAAVWYRLLDELAFRFLRGQRELFMAFLTDQLFFDLAVRGSPPDLIDQTMTARTREYANYRQWLPSEGSDLKGTLLWEAAKHVGEPIDLSTHPMFLALFGAAIVDKIMHASVQKLLVGQ
jgi:hypothetical protein